MTIFGSKLPFAVWHRDLHRSGKVVAAVSNGYPLYSISEADLSRLMSEVVECADAISRLLGAKLREREVEFGR